MTAVQAQVPQANVEASKEALHMEPNTALPDITDRRPSYLTSKISMYKAK